MTRDGEGLLSKKMWCVWTVILVMTPYRPFGYTFSTFPGQIPVASLSIVVVLLIAWKSVVPFFEEKHITFFLSLRKSLMRTALIAAVASLGAGLFQALSLRGGITSEGAIALYAYLQLSQGLCSIAAIFGWALWSELEGESAKGFQKRGHVTVLLIGALWSIPCVLAVELTGHAYTGCIPIHLTILLCILVGIPFLFVMRCRDGMEAIALNPLSFLSGHLSFLAVRLITFENHSVLFDKEVSNYILYGIYVGLLLLLALGSVIVSKRAENKTVTQKDALKADESTHYECVAKYLDSLAQRPLSDSERLVMTRTALGESAKNIAKSIGKAEGTVASFRHRGYEKLGIKGAQELRLLFKELDTDRENACDAKLANDSDGFRFRMTTNFVILGFLVVLPFVPQISELIIGSKVTYFASLRRAYFYVVMGLCAVLPLLGLCAEERREEIACREKVGLWSYPMMHILRQASFLLFAWCFYGAWDGVPFYAICALFVVCLSLVLFVQDAYSHSSVARNRFTLFRLGMDWLFEDKAGLALNVSAGLFLAQHLLLFPFPFFLYEVLPVVLLVVVTAGVMVLLYGWRITQGVGPEGVSEQKERSILYLRGRGMGELQAEVIADLARGLSPLEICVRRSTTLATVRSYRHRGYRLLDVHSLAELRNLLVKEAGITSER